MSTLTATTERGNVAILIFNISNNETHPNVTTTVGPVTMTSAELYIHSLFFQVFFSGIVTNVISVSIWVGIARNKNLRNRFYIFIGFLTFFRNCLCTNFFVVGVFRSLRTAGVADLSQRRLACHFMHFWLIDGAVLEQALVLAMVVDRMLALMAMNYYRSLTDRSAAYVCVGLYVTCTLITIGPSYMFDKMLEYAPCINVDNFLNENFGLYKRSLSLALICAIICFYVCLIFYVRKRIKVMEVVASKSEAGKLSLQRQMKLMPLFRNIVLIHCGFTLTSRGLLALALVVPNEYSQRLSTLGGIMVYLDSFINVATLLMKNEDIRKAAMWWRNDHVISI